VAPERKSLRRLAALLIATGALFALWLALTDNTRPLELLVGACCALIAAAGGMAAGLAGRAHFAPEPRWLLRTLALPWWVVRDSARVFAALVTRREGRFVTVTFPVGGSSPRDVARRVLAYAAGSAGPNTYAIGASEDGDVLVAHELVPAAVTPVEVVAER
jgi:hypothetical protein